MTGYICLREDGGVLTFGSVPVHRSTTGALGGSASAIAVDAGGDGYWVASQRGQVVALGVPDIVGPGGVPSPNGIVDLVATADDHGLWALDASGAVFCFGAAPFHGSVYDLELHAPVEAVTLTPTPRDGGYWVLDRSGGVFCFGNATFFGSMHDLGVPNVPAVALLAEPDGEGYTIVTEDGSSRAFGRAVEADSVTARHPIVAATKAPDGALLVDAKGIIYPLGTAPFLGTPATSPLTAPIVDVAWCTERVSG